MFLFKKLLAIAYLFLLAWPSLGMEGDNLKPRNILTIDGKATSAIFSDGDTKIVAYQSGLRGNLGTTKVFDAMTGNLISTSAGGSDQRTFSSISLDSTLRVEFSTMSHFAEVFSTDHKLLFKLNHTQPIVCVAFSKDSSKIVTASWDGRANIWNREGKLLFELPHQPDDGIGCWIVHSAAFSPDGTKVVTVASDNNIRIWQLPPRQGGL